MITLEILFFIIIGFASYLIGRTGHMLIGHLDIPHHWIPAVAMIILGGIFYPWLPGKISLFSGIGLLISDFKDFTEFKISGCDEVEEKRFWGFD